MQTGGNNLFIVVMIVFFAILIILALRELMTWYWKINRMVTLLELIEQHLRPDDEPEAQQIVETIQEQQQGDIQQSTQPKRKNPLTKV